MEQVKKLLLELVRSGLWGTEVRLSAYHTIDFAKVLDMIGQTLQVEQRNKTMNEFIASLVEKMRSAGIEAVLVKGQGVAQCYEKPLWRPSGDVDLLLSEANYRKAKEFLLPLSSARKKEERYSRHWGMNIGQWYVEIHGSLRSGLSTRVDRAIDAVQNEVFEKGRVRSWMNGETKVLLPAPDEDVFLVFTHFVKHFYKEGMTLRQVCDWCRLLWTYRSVLDVALQERWLRQAGLMDEWQAFAALAVDYLGMPEKSMPFYEPRFKAKGSQLVAFILDGYSGNKFNDIWQIARIFPWKAVRYAPSIFLNVNWLKVRERLFKSDGYTIDNKNN